MNNDYKYLVIAVLILPCLLTFTGICLYGMLDSIVLLVIGLVTLVLSIIGLAIFIHKDKEKNRIKVKEEEARRKAEEKRRAERARALINTGLSNVNSLSPKEFEEAVAEMLREKGFQAETTQYVGDYGVDVVAKRGMQAIAIQCKKYSGSVGVSAVQEVIAGKSYYHCNEAWVVTTADTFTQNAIKLAAANGVKLYTKGDFALFIQKQ